MDSPVAVNVRRKRGWQVPGRFYVNKHLEELMFDELAHHCKSGGVGGFLPAVKQIANVACLPGIVNVRINLPCGTLCAFALGDCRLAYRACAVFDRSSRCPFGLRIRDWERGRVRPVQP